MNKKNILFGIILIIAITSTACYFPKFISTESLIATEVEKTVNAIVEQTEAAKVAATYTPYPTYTPVPTATSVAVNPSFYNKYYNQYYPSDSGSRLTWYCLDPDFVSETISDNTVFSPGETFTKTWTLLNAGQCTWTTNYNLVFVSGNTMSGDTVSALPHDVPPGGIVVLSVNLKAPSSDGTYRGAWSVESDNGNDFADFWVQIKVR